MTAATALTRGVPVVGRRAFVEVIMGMPISLHVKALDAGRPDIAQAAGNVFAVLRTVDDLFSLWRPDSELSRLQAGAVLAGGCHPWQAGVLQAQLMGARAQRLSGRSCGHRQDERKQEEGALVHATQRSAQAVPGYPLCGLCCGGTALFVPGI